MHRESAHLDLKINNITFFYTYTWSGIQNPGMPKEWRRSEPQTSMTLRDSTLINTKESYSIAFTSSSETCIQRNQA